MNWGLFGALGIQVCTWLLLKLYTSSNWPAKDWYYLAFPRDTWQVKTVVTLVFLVETAQTIIITNDGFNVFARGFGNAMMLNKVQNEWIAILLFSAIGEYLCNMPPRLRTEKKEYAVSCSVQIFYAYRIYLLSRMKTLLLSIMAVRSTPKLTLATALTNLMQMLQLSLAGLVTGIISAVHCYQKGNWTEADDRTRLIEPVCHEPFSCLLRFNDTKSSSYGFRSVPPVISSSPPAWFFW